MFRVASRSLFPLAVFCLIVFALHQFLIYFNPTIYWIDAHIRAALNEQLIIEQWLPAIQFFVVFVSGITSDIAFLRSILSLLAIGTLVSTYFLAKRIFSNLTGLVAFLFLSLNMMFAALATVPYPDVLFVGFTFAVFNLLDEPPFTRRHYIGLVMLNLASLTRYEGWLLSALFVVESAVRLFRVMKWDTALYQTMKMALFCCIAPFAWLIFGLPDGNFSDRLWLIFNFSTNTVSPTFSDHILARTSPEYLEGFFSQYFRLLNWQIRTEFLVMGVAGILMAIINKAYRLVHLRILFFLFLDICVLAFIQPMDFGNLRQPFLLQAFLILYAAHGLVNGVSWLFQRISMLTGKPYPANWASQFAITMAVVLSMKSIPNVVEFVAVSSRETHFIIPYEIGTWLGPRLRQGDTILILDDTDFYPYALATYMGYPFDQILDDRLDTRLIQESLETAQMVYVMALYTSRDGLSPTETRILNDLENDHLQAERFIFGTTNVWYVPANQIEYSP